MIRLSHIIFRVTLEGVTYEGFAAERVREYRFTVWPGVRAALDIAAEDWGDCWAGSVRPVLVSLEYHLTNGEWSRVISKRFEECDLERLGLR